MKQPDRPTSGGAPLIDPELDQKLKARAAEITSISLDQLLRPELGDSGFVAFAPQFRPVWDLLQLFRLTDLTLVPDQLIHVIGRGFDVLMGTIEAMRVHKADPTQPAINQRSAPVNQFINGVYTEFYDALVRAVSFGYLLRLRENITQLEASFSRVRMELTGAMESRRAEFDATLQAAIGQGLKRLNEAEVTASTIVDSIRKAAGATGVGRESTHFDQRANAHRRQGTVWLAATIVLVAIFAIYAGGLAFSIRLVPAATDSRAAIIQIAGRLLLASVLLWAIAVAQRNYKAHRHNEILNRHRQTALATFETFVASTSNPEIKDAVLVQTTQSIFSVQPSGYLNTEPEGPPQTTIVEILRRFVERP